MALVIQTSVFLLIISLSLFSTKVTATTPRPCCFPKHASGQEYVYGNKLFDFFYDFEQQKFFQDYENRDEIQYVLFNTKTLWKYTRYTNHACRMNPITASLREHFSQCIPDNATSHPVSAGNKVDFFYKNGRAKGLIVARVDRGTCRPETISRNKVMDVYHQSDLDIDHSVLDDVDLSDCL